MTEPNTDTENTETEGDCSPASCSVTEFVYTWPDGREEVRYRRDMDSPDSLATIDEVLNLQRQHGASCPYSFRHV